MMLSRQFAIAICGLVTVSMFANDAMAQRGGGRGQATRARYALATLPEVQTELKMNDEQKKLATELLAKQREKMASFGGGGGGGDFAAMQAEMAKLNTELDGQLESKLDDAQKKRLNGLLAQVNGAAALLDASIAKAMQLNEEQIGKLKAANESNRSARREAMAGFQDMSQEERQAAMTKLTEKENGALLATLTEEQKKKFEELKGTPLKIDQTPLRGGRGGGRGQQ